MEKKIWMHIYAATIFIAKKKITKAVFYVSSIAITLE